jgi:DNA (cytosine-5)-methyltransferase 1
MAFIIADMIRRINPHIVKPARPQDRAEAIKRRDDLGIPQFNADRGVGENEFENLPGFPKGVVYAKEPQNRYQKWLRRAMVENGGDSSTKVTAHYTTRWKPKIIEATANVPLRALADHRGISFVTSQGSRSEAPYQTSTTSFSLIERKRKNKPMPSVSLSDFVHVVPRSMSISVLYGRLDSEGYFKCAVTTLSPVAKNQWPLHPTVSSLHSDDLLAS